MGKITRFKAPVTCADSCISMQKNHVQERFSYLRLHHRYLPPDRVMVWSLNSCLDPHFSASYVRSNRKHIDPFPPNNQSTCSDIGASAFEGNSWFQTWCRYVPDVVLIRSERGLGYLGTWLRYVPNLLAHPSLPPSSSPELGILITVQTRYLCAVKQDRITINTIRI